MLFFHLMKTLFIWSSTCGNVLIKDFRVVYPCNYYSPAFISHHVFQYSFLFYQASVSHPSNSQAATESNQPSRFRPRHRPVATDKITLEHMSRPDCIDWKGWTQNTCETWIGVNATPCGSGTTLGTQQYPLWSYLGTPSL